MHYNHDLSLLSERLYEILPKITVAVLGLGGAGSALCQSLAHIGVRNFILIDDDLVEESNMNKLIGAKPSDIGSKKSHVIKQFLSHISGNSTEVAIVDKKFTRSNQSEIVSALSGASFVFSCVDNPSGREEINNFCVRNKKPFIDFGVGMAKDKNGISSLVGQIIFVKVGDPCLECYAIQNRLPYGNNKVPFVHVHQVLTGLALQEFLKFLTDFGHQYNMVCFDALRQSVEGLRPYPNSHRCSLCKNMCYDIIDKTRDCSGAQDETKCD